MQKNNNQITLFDTLVTSDQLQEIKVVLPYLPFSLQRFAGLYSKIEELKNAFFLFSNMEELEEFSARDKAPETMFDELRSYLTDEQITSLENLNNIKSMMELLHETDSGGDENAVNMERIFEMMNKKGSEFYE